MRVRPGEGEQADAVQFLMQVQPDERANADAPGLGESVTARRRASRLRVARCPRWRASPNMISDDCAERGRCCPGEARLMVQEHPLVIATTFVEPTHRPALPGACRLRRERWLREALEASA